MMTQLQFACTPEQAQDKLFLEQKIREELSVQASDVAEVRGALTLYMDFINLFINLLQLFGDRK